MLLTQWLKSLFSSRVEGGRRVLKRDSRRRGAFGMTAVPGVELLEVRLVLSAIITSTPTSLHIDTGNDAVELNYSSDKYTIYNGLGISGTGGTIVNGNTFTTNHPFTGQLSITIIGNGGVWFGANVPYFKSTINIVSGIVDMNNQDRTFGALTGSGTVRYGSGGTLREGTLTVGSNGATTTFSGVIEEDYLGRALSLVKTGGGKLTLTGDNTYSGTTTVTEGTLQIGDGGTTGTLGSGAVTDDATLFINRRDSIHVSNAISGSGTLTLTSSGGEISQTAPITVSTVNASAATGITLTNSSNAFSNFSATNTSGAISVVNAATLSLTGITQSGSGNVSISSTGANTGLTVSGGVTGSGGSVTLQATGSLVVGVNQTINSSSGSLTLGADLTSSGVGDDGTGTLTISAGANVYGASLTLRGADEEIDNTATVGSATAPVTSAPVSTFVASTRGLNQPAGLVIDSSGNVYVSNFDGRSISKVTPGGVVSTFATGLNLPNFMTLDGSGNLYVNNGGSTIIQITPAGVVSNYVQFLTNAVACAFDRFGTLYIADFTTNTIYKKFGLGTEIFATGFSSPHGMAFDSSGNLYVANQGSTTISKVTPAGVVSTFASGFRAPVGVTFDPNGNMYVSDLDGDSISKVTFSSPGVLGAITTYVSSGLDGPLQTAFDTSGNLYVANYKANTVSKVSPPSTAPASTFVDNNHGLSGPAGLVIDTSGNVYVSNYGGGSISKVTPGGVVSTFATGLNLPNLMTLDGSGNLYVNNGGNTVSKITPAGVVSTYVDNNHGLTDAVAVAFDSSNNLYVVNYNPGTISKITPGGVASIFATGFSSPHGMAFDSSGNLYVANQGSTTVSKVTPAGVVSTFASGFSAPGGVTFDSNGNMYVSNLDGVSKVTFSSPGVLGAITTYVSSGLDVPLQTAFDTRGNLYVANYKANTVSKVRPNAATTQATIRSSLSSRPMSLGGLNTAVSGINLTDAELAQIVTTSSGTVTIGDTSQTGNITFSTATVATTAGAATTVVQGGEGQIILDNAAGAGTALDGNTGNVNITAGIGGIDEAATNTAGTADISAADTTLTSLGGIGVTKAVQLATTSLNTNTVGYGWGQALKAIGSVTVGTSGLNADFATVMLQGGTFTLGGSNRINDVTVLDLSGPATFAIAGFNETVRKLQLRDASASITGTTGVLTSTQTIEGQAGTVSAKLGGSIGLTKTTSGRLTLSGANTYTGVTTVSAGTLLVNGSLANGVAATDVTVASGATLGGTGTINGVTSVSGKLAPGNSPGILKTSDFTFANNSTFEVEIGGTTAGTANNNHDQLNVTGTITIGSNVTLSTLQFNSFVPVAGNKFTILVNDGTDLISGTFSGLGEGATISNFLGSGLNATITYVANTDAGSVGNDVVLTVQHPIETSVELSGGNLIITDSNGGTSNDTLTLSINGTNVRVYDPNNVLEAGAGTTQVDAKTVDVPLTSITGSIQVNTLAGNDSLTIDLSGGNFVDAIVFHGGTGGNDSLTVTGGTTTTVTHTFTNANDGSVTLAGALAGTITYTGLEPITDNLLATNRVFTFNGVTETVTVTDGTASDGMTMINLTLSESVYFTNPTNSLTIDAGTDTVNFQTSATSLAGGAVTVTAGVINVNADLRTSGGAINLSATGNLTVGTGVTVNSSAGTLTLNADSDADGTGTLSIYSGAGVYGTDITLRAADVDIDSTATVGSDGVPTVSTFANVGTGPRFMAYDLSGNLYVANAVSGTISKITPAGVVSTFASGLDSPTGLAFDGSGNLYVTSRFAHTITKITFSAPGVFESASTFVNNAQGLINPMGLAFDGSGNLYVANAGGNNVLKVTFSAPGTFESISTLFNAVGGAVPFGLAFDVSGNLYVANNINNTISKVTFSAPGVFGSSSVFVDNTQGLSGPIGLAFDVDGNLFVANLISSVIFKVTPSAVITNFATLLAAGPHGLVFDGSGNLYATNPSFSRVDKLTATAVATNQATIRSSVSSRPMSLGGTNTAVAGINLTDAELARLFTTSSGTVTFGDTSQTGNLTFTTATTATTAGATTLIVQSTNGAGQIILDNSTGAGTALNGNTGNITLTAGTGGIVEAATNTTGIAAIGSATSASLTSAGTIGTSSKPIQLGTTSLTTNSSTNNNNQFLKGTGAITIGATTGLDAGTAIVELDGGTFTLGGSDCINDNTKLNVNGSTFAIAGFNETVNTLTLTSGSITGSGGTLTSTNTIQTMSGSASAILAGTNGLSQSTSGTTTLSGANSYTGATTITGGVLSVSLLANGSANSGLGASSSVAANLVLDGGTLRYTGPTVSTNRLFTLGASGGTIDVSGTGPVNFTNTGAMGFTGSAGARTLTLTGTQTAPSTIAAVISGGGIGVSLDGTVGLNNSLAAGSSNFHPQGMGFDPFANELLFLQQNTGIIYRTDLNGSILGSRPIGGITYNGVGGTDTIARFTVSIAADAANYYFSDYTNNSSGYDLYAVGKLSGSAATISTEIAAYGGYPIDVRNGLIYRTQPSTTYGFGNLNQIRIAAVGAPDTILNTLTLAAPFGIADFSVDPVGGNIWTLDYSASASIRQYDLTTGNLLNVFPLGLDGVDAGLTYANGKLYYYNWNSGSGSTLSTYTAGSARETSIVKNSTGAWTLSGANTYSGATTISGGRLNVNGSITSNVTVASTGTLGGTGTINSANSVTVQCGGTVAPGTSPGILNSGTVTFNSGSNFNVELNGTSLIPTPQYDQLNVTGAVTLNDGNLVVTLGYTPANGDSFVIINNDMADAVTGTFFGLDEGEVFTAGGSTFQITYQGGTGNDVVLTTINPAAPTFSGTPGGDNFVVKLDLAGTNVETYLAGNLIDSRTLASITGVLTINGLAGNDTLTVDFSAGNPLPASGLSFNGGDPTVAAGDSLTLTGGTTNSITHTFTNANDGSVTLAGALAGTINYTGLEPITDNLTATDRVFTFNGGAETITLTDATGANMTIDSTLGESVTFANPSGSLTINAGTGNDIINVEGVDAAYAGSLTINGDAGTDTVNFQTNATALAGGSVTVTADVINVNAGVATGGGNVSLTATEDIVVGANVSISSDGGSITLNADSDQATTPGGGVKLNIDSSLTSSGGNITIGGGDDPMTKPAIGTATSKSAGFYAEKATVSSGTGNISIRGQGQDGVILGRGVVVFGGTKVESTTGSITLVGTGGGNSTLSQHEGVVIQGNNSGTPATETQITSIDGHITITGVAGVNNSSTGNRGVSVSRDARVQSTGGGNIVITGTGTGTSAGTNNSGVSLTEDGVIANTSGTLTINATGGINSSGLDFDTAANNRIGGALTSGAITINTDTFAVSNGSLQSSGALTIQPMTASATIGIGGGVGTLNISDTELTKLTDGFSSITIGDVVNGTGAVDIDTTAFTDPVTIAGGTIHDHGGTDISNSDATTPSITLKGTVSPGQSPGILNVVGDFAFADDDIFDVEIGGTTPGSTDTNHDQLAVTGTVTIGNNVTLNLSSWMGFVPLTKQSFTIIDNDGVDDVVGIFDGLIEGATVSSNFLGSGLAATISYKGGTGNDVVITMAGFTLSKIATSSAEGSTDTFTVVLDTPPASAVVINVGSSSTSVATVSPASLKFTSANWDVPQTVTVSGVDDTGSPATITLSINDALSDNGFDSLPDQTVSATVTNVAPTVSVNLFASTLTIDEQGFATLKGTISDVGILDTFSLVVNWGDPFSPDNVQTFLFSASSTGTQDFTLIHQYLDDNPTGSSSDDYTVSLTVTDDDNGVGTTSVTVTVNNLAPTANTDGPDTTPTITDPFTVNEKSAKVINVLANDTDPAGGFNPLKGEADDVLMVATINGAAVTPGTTVTLPSGALLTINADGTQTYDPNNAYFYLALGKIAFDTFTYTNHDGDLGTSNTATVTITILGENDIWVDVDNDGLFNPGAGDIDVTLLAEDGVFDARKADGFYSPVPGAGLGINATLNLTTDMIFTADGTITIIGSDLFTTGTFTAISYEGDIVVTDALGIDSVITAGAGITLQAVACAGGMILVSPGSILTATGTPDADIHLFGDVGVTISGATLTASDEILIVTSSAFGDLLANKSVLTATDIRIVAFGNVEAIDALLTGSSSVRIESRNGSGNISGAIIKSNGAGGNVSVTTLMSLTAGAGTVNPNVDIQATTSISLFAAYGPLSIPSGVLKTTDATGFVKLRSLRSISAPSLLVTTAGSLSLLVESLERNGGYSIDVSQAVLSAKEITIKAPDSVTAINLTATSTSGNLSIASTYGNVTVTGAVLKSAADLILDAAQGNIVAPNTTMTAGTAGSGSISVLAQSNITFTNAVWTAATNIAISAPGTQSGGGLVSGDAAQLTAPVVNLYTKVPIQANDIKVNAVTSVTITAYGGNITAQGAQITASAGVVNILGDMIDFSPSGMVPSLISGLNGVTMTGHYSIVNLSGATVLALGGGADITVNAWQINAAGATITANDAVQLNARYQIGAATNSTVDVSGALLTSITNSVQVWAFGMIDADNAILSAVNLAELFSQYGGISAELAKITASALASGTIRLDSSGKQNLKKATLKADRIVAIVSSAELDATDAVFAKYGDPSTLIISARDDIFLAGAIRPHVTQSISSQTGTVYY